MALSAERKDAIAADVRDWSLITSACEDYEDLPDTDAGDCYVKAPDSGRGLFALCELSI
jgi:hypothetical protein